eukprot:6175709-Pleurochrysis_carterae.AAC.2
MRDKKNNQHYDADDREAEILTSMQQEQEDEALKIQWSKIPDQKPAARPNADDSKTLAFLKKRNLVPDSTELAELQSMLDDIEGHKETRAKLLKELQQMPTTKDVHDSYQWLAYSLTFHDEKEHHPSLFEYHQKLHGQ